MAKKKKYTMKDLEKALKKAPIVELTGVVAANGTGGCISKGKLWTFMLELCVWKTKGGGLNHKKLIITEEVSKAVLDKRMDHFNDYDKVKARYAEDIQFKEVDMWHYANLKRIIKDDVEDKEFDAAIKKLTKPVIYKNPYFGKFKFDRGINWFMGNGDWLGKEVFIHLDLDQVDVKEGIVKAVTELVEKDKMLEALTKIWNKQEAWDKKIKQAIANKFIKLRNDDWADSDEKRVTKKDFHALLKPQSFSVQSDGTMSFCFEDGGLFFGHVFMGGLSLKKGVIDVELAG